MNSELRKLLIGAGLSDLVSMPKKDYVEEHNKLIGLLRSSDDPRFQKEADEQARELKAMVGGLVGDGKPNPKAGFIRRMMWETKHRNDGKYKYPTTPAPDSTMKARATFAYSKMENKEKISPFITKHFGNAPASASAPKKRKIRIVEEEAPRNEIITPTDESDKIKELREEYERTNNYANRVGRKSFITPTARMLVVDARKKADKAKKDLDEQIKKEAKPAPAPAPASDPIETETVKRLRKSYESAEKDVDRATDERDRKESLARLRLFKRELDNEIDFNKRMRSGEFNKFATDTYARYKQEYDDWVRDGRKGAVIFKPKTLEEQKAKLVRQLQTDDYSMDRINDILAKTSVAKLKKDSSAEYDIVFQLVFYHIANAYGIQMTPFRFPEGKKGKEIRDYIYNKYRASEKRIEKTILDILAQGTS